MSFMLPTPKSITADEVVLSRHDWDNLVRVFGEGTEDDLDDFAAVKAARKSDRGAFGRQTGDIETTIPIEIVKAKVAGAHPVAAWRHYRGLSRSDLERQSGVPGPIIERIEGRRGTEDSESLSRIALALRVPPEALLDNHAAGDRE